VDLLELTRTLRELKHDMKFHLNTMQALAQKQEYEKLNVYIQDFDNQINQIHYLVSTGNTAIDCTLSPKINIAKEKNIPFDYTLILPENLPIRDIDLSVLLGNLVDNALEAAVLCDLPWIQLQIKPFNNMLSIYVRNSYRGTPATKGSLEHGLGVHRIKEIVEKYKGTSRIIPEADSFAVHILLPLEDF
jgi:sensor histidine kinase regulating citrate/malate metabolism